ncbi:hypothetical protein [Minwuia thermotolerans]|uniref:Uncharacterized protein n=1 Tax=Minwuia thermotolerans TaxID=2056226 RepID=A0A2M9G590_9PROT|nr:hypothetical protein [Minwuia thermotolerans]PJK30885.1 hypothetical protein CVT23_04230 [Minwuia thermotolerans]
MAEDKEKPVWERIAELGFADAVESKGFRRVGRTHWRLDGDGIVHHVKLYRGFAIEPGSFRDFLGTFFPGLDKLYERVDAPPLSRRIPYGRALCHRDQTIYDSYYVAEVSRYQTAFPEVPPAQGFWERIKQFWPPQRPDFSSEFFRPLPYWDSRVTEDAGSGAWLTDGANLRDVADVVTSAWADHEGPLLAAGRSLQSYYEHFDRTRWRDARHFDIDRFLMAILADDLITAKEIVADTFERVRHTPSLEEMYASLWKQKGRLASSVDWRRLRQTPQGKEMIRFEAASLAAAPMFEARRALQCCEKFGIELGSKPEIDSAFIEAYERGKRAWYSESR